jgi:hypothetical protein
MAARKTIIPYYQIIQKLSTEFGFPTEKGLEFIRCFAKNKGHQIISPKYNLEEIQKDATKSKAFLAEFPQNRSFRDIIAIAHQLCPELQTFCEQNGGIFNGLGSRDKGALGKQVEFYIFGQLPNGDPVPDLAWGADIKATHFKTNRSGDYNAKERLTITNCGSTEKYETFGAVQAAATLQTCKYYPKIKSGVLFVFEHSGGKYNDIDANMSKHLMCAFPYDLADMPDEVTKQLNADFIDIQTKISTQTVSQKGQKYLHIHKHGSKGGQTRAFGFTNKFLTKLVSIVTEKPITIKGRSIFIEKQHFA